jgi:hypothetical protein
MSKQLLSLMMMKIPMIMRKKGLNYKTIRTSSSMKAITLGTWNNNGGDGGDKYCQFISGGNIILHQYLPVHYKVENAMTLTLTDVFLSLTLLPVVMVIVIIIIVVDSNVELGTYHPQ